MSDFKEIFKNSVKELSLLLLKIEYLEDDLIKIANILIDCLKNGNKILICGNGGSAADAQHMAAEIVGRFKKNRKPLAAIALTTDTSILTAISNDFSFDDVFERQVEALAKKGDVIIGISTSGNSKNVIKAFNKAKEMGVIRIGLLGKGGALKELSDFCITIDSSTPRVQEIHSLLIHILCEIIESEIS